MTTTAFGLTGLSGSGKTTLMTQLIDWFCQHGVKVSAIKHTHHGFDLEQPGKDSWRMREAGAGEVYLVSNQRAVLMSEFRDSPEPTVAELLQRMSPCDLVLVEGFKRDPLPKLEVFRPSLDNPPVWPGNSAVVAIASDEPVDAPLPVLDLDDIEGIARFIAAQTGIALP